MNNIYTIQKPLLNSNDPRERMKEKFPRRSNRYIFIWNHDQRWVRHWIVECVEVLDRGLIYFIPSFESTWFWFNPGYILKANNYHILSPSLAISLRPTQFRSIFYPVHFRMSPSSSHLLSIFSMILPSPSQIPLSYQLLVGYHFSPTRSFTSE